MERTESAIDQKCIHLKHCQAELVEVGIRSLITQPSASPGRHLHYIKALTFYTTKKSNSTFLEFIHEIRDANRVTKLYAAAIILFRPAGLAAPEKKKGGIYQPARYIFCGACCYFLLCDCA